MTKTDLVNFIAEETGLTKADSARAVDAMLSGVIKGLKEEQLKMYIKMLDNLKILELVKQLLYLQEMLQNSKLVLN